MNVIRAFIAISLSAEIVQGLDRVLRDLNSRLPDVPVRWVPAKNIHLTLKFLGDVSLTSLDLLTTSLQHECLRHSQFDLSVGGVGAFPSPRRARVVWVGVQAPAELAALQHGIEAEMARLGYDPEDRPFSPHLTLGRVARHATAGDQEQLNRVLSASTVGFLGALRLTSVQLYRSELRPSGSVYSVLSSAPLAGPLPGAE